MNFLWLIMKKLEGKAGGGREDGGCGSLYWLETLH